MFDLCRDKCYLPADRERIVRLMLSFNEPMVAPANHHAQPTPAYICTLKEDEGFSVYIYLYLTSEKVGLLYRYTDEIRTADGCKAAEEEAVQFAEDMGCLIDDLHFSNLLSEQQDKLLATIPLFSSNQHVGSATPAAPIKILNTSPIPPSPIPGGKGEIFTVKREEAPEEIPQEGIEPVQMQEIIEPVKEPQVEIETVQVEEITEQPEILVEKGALAEEEKVEKETKEAAGKEEQPWEPQLFLSKFRRRAMAEKEKKDSIENLGRVMATI